MENEIPFLIKKFDIKVNGILHVGAHKCEEYNTYQNITSNILWIEAFPELVEECKKIYPEINIINSVVSDKDNDTIEFFISSNSKCSSIMDFDYHKELYPEIIMNSKITLQTKKIITLYRENGINDKSYNLLVIDIQGAELMALNGMENLINSFDAVYVEVAEKALYKGGCTLEDLDIFFIKNKFSRKYLMLLNEYGNAFYIKKNNL